MGKYRGTKQHSHTKGSKATQDIMKLSDGFPARGSSRKYPTLNASLVFSEGTLRGEDAQVCLFQDLDIFNICDLQDTISRQLSFSELEGCGYMVSNE